MTSHRNFILKPLKLCKKKAKKCDFSKETYKRTLKAYGPAKLKMNDVYETA